MKTYTYAHRYAARTVTGSIVTVPDQVYQDQHGYDQAHQTFPVLRRDGSTVRAKIRGDLYGLHTVGTGDMVVAIV